jgi:RNA polymerase sigma factor (sigma-70 family)
MPTVPARRQTSPIRVNCRRDRDALIEEYAWRSEDRPGLVGMIAGQLVKKVPPCFDYRELVAAGNLGLLQAARRYTPEGHGGTPFSAYARFRIRGAMLDSVRRKNWEHATTPPIPDDAQVAWPIEEIIDNRRLLARLREAIARLPERQQAVIREFYLQRNGTAAMVGAALGMDEFEAERERAAAICELRGRLEAAA